jgi:hypothetical protein
MHRVTQCLICNGNSLESHAAIFSPFIAKRIWNREPFPIELLTCKSCNFIFANPRIEPQEEKALYADYRGTEYQMARHSAEPWYTDRFNRSMFSSETLAKRRAPLERVLRQHIPAGIKNILDFGGDRGDLFQGLIPGSSTYVYDISGIEPVNGVKALRGLKECAAYTFDLIACSNVLEHVTSPKELLENMKEIASDGTLVFVEVPSETPFGPLTFMKRLAQQVILLGARPGLAVSMLPFDFGRQVHEHINFFSLDALTKLMQLTGMEVLSNGLYPSEGYSFGPYKIAAGKLAWCIARCRTNPDSDAPARKG